MSDYDNATTRVVGKCSMKPITNGRISDDKPVDPRSRSWFQPGNNANPAGRPKGSRNKLGEAFVAQVYQAWLEGGPHTIRRLREDDPAAFLRLIVSVLPKTNQPPLDAGSGLAEMSDADIAAALDDLNRLAVSLGIRPGGPADPTGTSEL